MNPCLVCDAKLIYLFSILSNLKSNSDRVIILLFLLKSTTQQQQQQQQKETNFRRLISFEYRICIEKVARHPSIRCNELVSVMLILEYVPVQFSVHDSRVHFVFREYMMYVCEFCLVAAECMNLWVLRISHWRSNKSHCDAFRQCVLLVVERVHMFDWCYLFHFHSFNLL